MGKKRKGKEKDSKSQESDSASHWMSISPLAWSNASLLVSLIALLALWKNNFYKSPNPDTFLEFIRVVTPVAIIIIFIEKSSLSRKILNPESLAHRRLWSQIRFVLSVIVLARVLLPIIYQSSFPEKVTEFITVQIPTLGSGVVKIITQIAAILTSLTTSGIGNILLGIISSWIYDLIKDFYTRIKEKRKVAKS